MARVDRESYPPGSCLVGEGAEREVARLLLGGCVRLSRSIGDSTVSVALLGAGDVVGAEFIVGRRPFAYRAECVTECDAYLITKQVAYEGVEASPVYLRPWLLETLRLQPNLDRPGGVNLSTIYSIASLTYAYARLLSTEREQGQELRVALAPLRQELYKAKPFSGHQVAVLQRALSDVGLVELREGDPLAPSLAIPDTELFVTFLVFLQSAADMQEGLYKLEQPKAPLLLDRATEHLVDGILLHEEVQQRILHPERGMMHLSLEELSEFYKLGGGEEALSDDHPALKRLSELDCLTLIHEHSDSSAFLHLRPLLRLNLRRDPATSFQDIIDYLLGQLWQYRIAGSEAGSPSDRP